MAPIVYAWARRGMGARNGFQGVERSCAQGKGRIATPSRLVAAISLPADEGANKRLITSGLVDIPQLPTLARG